ncbi:MAG: exo-alpha-sialidase, partial [Bacteroidaceae bacterium]|nr:exo-alpha-sialidase [Bacteroidaceae bacterium]
MKRILLLSFMLFLSILGTKAAADDADGATIVKIAVSVKGKPTYPTNQRCGYITADDGSGSSTIEVLASQNGKTLEMKLPSGKAVSYRGEAYHGWDFEGVTVTDGIAKVSFTANTRTEYQCLAYTDFGTQYYRIPAIARNYRDELVAVYDVRECRNDVGFGEVDQAMRYSKDNGKTWSEETIIA